jgi:hypothetical protein
MSYDQQPPSWLRAVTPLAAEEPNARVAKLERAFAHQPLLRAWGSACLRCGLDERDPIHTTEQARIVAGPMWRLGRVRSRLMSLFRG